MSVTPPPPPRPRIPPPPPILQCQGADFDRTSGLMSGALRGIDGLLRGGARQGHMCYLISFALCIFLLLWWMMGKR